ncbi:hypothetical protein ASG49_13770 [Marmoricola sp. Leaf446]|uniref:hypothetical protein n=1 Tax=Marmoricola sp. Leaf446 TaxID=1736379 RepID=UPI0006FE20D5|nr:hypothetical protein [Marmoricola sp. Leaf446]KQT90804.1 hypothetical protein ASG49_13770 [Marmoricola sp. Leaf446]
MSDDQPRPDPAGPPVRTSDDRAERSAVPDGVERPEDRAEAVDDDHAEANEPTGGDDIGA